MRRRTGGTRSAVTNRGGGCGRTTSDRNPRNPKRIRSAAERGITTEGEASASAVLVGLVRSRSPRSDLIDR